MTVMQKLSQGEVFLGVHTVMEFEQTIQGKFSKM